MSASTLSKLMLRNCTITSTRYISTTPRYGISKNSFRAAVCTEFKKPLQIQDIPRPEEVPEGHVRIAIHSTGINYADLLMQQGTYQQKVDLPYIPGAEFSGTILECGSDVNSYNIGEKVFGFSHAIPDYRGFAEEIIVPTRVVLPMPENVSYPIAAGFSTSYGTAYGALTRRANVKEGETVLVTAAAGATGIACVDLAANIFKCKVIAACGSDEKCEAAKNKGAWETVNYTSEDLAAKVKKATRGQGVDIIVDMVGGDLWNQCLRCVGFEGRMVIVGFASGDIPQMPIHYLLMKSASALGFYWGNYGIRGHPHFLDSIKHVTKLLEEGKIAPEVSKTFPLEKVNEAYKFLSERRAVGKVIVNPRD